MKVFIRNYQTDAPSISVEIKSFIGHLSLYFYDYGFLHNCQYKFFVTSDYSELIVTDKDFRCLITSIRKL